MIAAGLLPEQALSENLFSVSVPATRITLDPDAIAQSMGYGPGAMPPHFREMLDDAARHAISIASIQAGYRLITPPQTPSGKSQQIRIDSETIFETGSRIASFMKGASALCFFALTLGPSIDTWIRELTFQQDYTGSYMANAVASAVAEGAVEILHGHINAVAQKQSLSISNRYSPGYCDWSVIDQHKLFGLFPNQFCGITLTDSALMLPIKSVSGMVALGSKVRFSEHNCDACRHPDCTYRAIRKAQNSRKEAGLRSRAFVNHLS